MREIKKLCKNNFLKMSGDFETFAGKLPGFPWAKYSGEKHLPGHSYTGRV